MNEMKGKKPSIPIIFEDNHLLIVEKPVNILSQGDHTGDADLLSLLKEDLRVRYHKPGNVYLGLVHRLDRPVGGIMVFAKTSKAAARLSAQLRANQLRRAYLAVVPGKPPRQGTLTHFLHKNAATNLVTAVESTVTGAKKAVLTYQLLKTVERHSLLWVELQTGRPHQIRVQLAAAGYPILNDHRYGGQVKPTGRPIALWSYALGLHHPTQKTSVGFTCPPPPTLHPWLLFPGPEIAALTKNLSSFPAG